MRTNQKKKMFQRPERRKGFLPHQKDFYYVIRFGMKLMSTLYLGVHWHLSCILCGTKDYSVHCRLRQITSVTSDCSVSNVLSSVILFDTFNISLFNAIIVTKLHGRFTSNDHLQINLCIFYRFISAFTYSTFTYFHDASVQCFSLVSPPSLWRHFLWLLCWLCSTTSSRSD